MGNKKINVEEKFDLLIEAINNAIEIKRDDYIDNLRLNYTLCSDDTEKLNFTVKRIEKIKKKLRKSKGNVSEFLRCAISEKDTFYDESETKSILVSNFIYSIIEDEELSKTPIENIENIYSFINNSPFDYSEIENFIESFALAHILSTLELLKKEGNLNIEETSNFDITNHPKLPYKIALLNELGFFELPKIKNLTKSNQIKVIKKLIGGSDRQIKGNINVLNPSSKEDGTRYTSIIYMEDVSKFINKLSN